MKYKETVEPKVNYSMTQPLRVVLFKDTTHIMERVYRAFSVTVTTMTLHILKTLTLKKDIANFPIGKLSHSYDHLVKTQIRDSEKSNDTAPQNTF